MPVRTSSTLTAADVMTPNPFCCDARSTVLEAVQIFRDADCGAVPVLSDGLPVGVLTDRDVALALADFDDRLRSMPVAEITTPGVISVGPTVSLNDVVTRFGDLAVRRVLVVDDQGRLMGIIGWADVARHVSDTRVGRAVSRVVEKD